MKKEILISVLIGLTLGLIITYGVYRFRSSQEKTPATTLSDVVATTPSPDVETSSIISIHSPLDGTVTTDTALTVTGSTIANSYVVLFVNDTEAISSADSAGNFSFQTKLAVGPNILRIHVLDESGAATVVERAVIVAPAEASTVASPSATPNLKQ